MGSSISRSVLNKTFLTVFTWTTRRSLRRTSWALLAGNLLFLGACRDAADVESPRAASSPTEQEVATENQAPSAADAEKQFADVSPENLPVASSNPEIASDDHALALIGPAPDPQSATRRSEPKTTGAAAASAPTQLKLEPTAEQLTRWAKPAFETLELLACREGNGVGWVGELAQLPDGKQFITAGTKVILWSVEAELPIHTFLELSNNQSIKSLAVSPDGQWFAAGDSEGMLRVWNVPEQREQISKALYANDIIHIAISPDAQEIATISYDNEITIWSADQLQQKNRFKVETNGVKRIEYLTTELLVAAGEATSSWDVRSGKQETTLSPGRYHFSLARTRDGERFLFGDKDGLQLWNIAEAKIESALAGGFSSDELVAFSTDGKLLATANGAAVRLWNVDSRQMLQIMDAYGWPITGLSWLPETDLLLVASENGRVRVWGTKSAGAAVGLQPLQTAVVLPDPTSRVPATPAQLLQIIDLRVFPRLPNSEVRINDTFSVSYEAAVTPEEAQLFYGYQLRKVGWEEVATNTPTPGSRQFNKNGFMISVACYDAPPAKTSVSVDFAGNYDLRWIPKFDAAPIEIVFENENTVIYRTQAELLQLETTLLRKLHAAGWTAYAQLHASQSEQPDRRDLKFVWNGMTLHVSIGRLPADPSSFNVQYTRFLTSNSVPIPHDSGFVEFDSATEPYLVATTALDLAETRSFYDRELAAEGWLAQGRTLQDAQNWLSFVRGQQDLTLGLQKPGNDRTLVRIGDELEKASWQLAKPEAPTGANSLPVVGIEAADFPILNNSKNAKFDASGKSLEFSMDAMPLAKVAEVYTAEMEAAGWQWDGRGIQSEDYSFLTFVKEKVEIALRARIMDGQSIVNIQGDGLLWTKPLPGGKPQISYEAWLRSNKFSAGLDLLDDYESEMRAR